MASRSAERIAQRTWPENVVAFRFGVLPRHQQLLNRWLQAGSCMGLCDASIYPPSQVDSSDGGYVLVWVRENPDPAYMIVPENRRWVVTDNLRQQVLARFRSFDEALNFIRPVLPQSSVAA